MRWEDCVSTSDILLEYLIWLGRCSLDLCQEQNVTCSLFSTALKLSYTDVTFHERKKKKMNFLLCLKSLSLRHKNWAYFLFWTFQMISLVLFYTCHFPSLLLSIYSFTHKESRKLRTLIFPSLLCSSYLWFLSKHTCAVNYWGVVS